MRFFRWLRSAPDEQRAQIRTLEAELDKARVDLRRTRRELESSREQENALMRERNQLIFKSRCDEARRRVAERDVLEYARKLDELRAELAVAAHNAEAAAAGLELIPMPDLPAGTVAVACGNLIARFGVCTAAGKHVSFHVVAANRAALHAALRPFLRLHAAAPTQQECDDK